RFPFDKFVKRKKWDPYKGYKYGHRYSRMLPSGYYENQAWGALHKAWIGYNIAKNKSQFVRQIKYAKTIRKLQRELGLELTDFKILR
ncbi:MAG: hypothetical protein QOK90_08215, partial [Nitrososphaeraceae archaeon]|nr:hypothetical protein [Nitrososphaeraceae archaeon]